MKRIKIGVLAVLLVAALAGCGKGETPEITEVMESGDSELATDDMAGTEELATNDKAGVEDFATGNTAEGDKNELASNEVPKETSDDNDGAASKEESSQASDRVYSKECVGVLTISINPEVDLEIDKDGKVLAVVFRNEDAKTAYQDLNLEGIAAEDAVKMIVETADKKGYLKDDGGVTVVYGSTGNASAEEARDMIDGVRDAVMGTLNALEKEGAVTLEMENYAQETSDICDACFGVGSIVCDLCGGVGFGNGMVLCDQCLGTGIYDDGHVPEGAGEGGGPEDDGLCRTCRGSGIMTIQAQTCYICKGTGLCINCGGSGIDPEPDDQGNMGACHACGGDGDCLQEVCEGGTMIERHETCRDCNGTGQDTGNFSGTDQGGNPGEGENPGEEQAFGCNRCQGSGRIECNRCGGTLIGTCNRCNGTGINQH